MVITRGYENICTSMHALHHVCIQVYYGSVPFSVLPKQSSHTIEVARQLSFPHITEDIVKETETFDNKQSWWVLFSNPYPSGKVQCQNQPLP